MIINFKQFKYFYTDYYEKKFEHDLNNLKSDFYMYWIKKFDKLHHLKIIKYFDQFLKNKKYLLLQ
jgi:hypothetical protein